MEQITIVAGEASGDNLGAGLMRALKAKNPNLRFSGICGPAMQSEGMQALNTIENINSIGFDNLFSRIHKILRIRKALIEHLLQNKPDIYIGIDAPDFNLTVEQRLKSAGIPTVQYVAPSIWAWRSYRIRKLKKAISRLLTIYPFESRLYLKSGIPFTYIGHPLADEIQINSDSTIRSQFGYDADDIVVALLPGSRMSEVRRLAPVFIDTARELYRSERQMKFITPLVNREIGRFFKQTLKHQGSELPFQLRERQSREVIAAADVVLTASGTAPLEAALSRKPVVVAYRVSLPTLVLAKLMVKVEHYSILNHLGDKPVIPEFIQSECHAQNLTTEVQRVIKDADYRTAMLQSFDQFRAELKNGANERAAEEILSFLS